MIVWGGPPGGGCLRFDWDGHIECSFSPFWKITKHRWCFSLGPPNSLRSTPCPQVKLILQDLVHEMCAVADMNRIGFRSLVLMCSLCLKALAKLLQLPAGGQRGSCRWCVRLSRHEKELLAKHNDSWRVLNRTFVKKKNNCACFLFQHVPAMANYFGRHAQSGDLFLYSWRVWHVGIPDMCILTNTV